MPAHDGANSNKGGVQGLLDLLKEAGTDREDCRRFGAVKRFCHNVKCANYGIVQLVRPNVRHTCKYLGKGCSKPLLRQTPSSQWQRLVENESCEQLREDGLMSAAPAWRKQEPLPAPGPYSTYGSGSKSIVDAGEQALLRSSRSSSVPDYLDNPQREYYNERAQEGTETNRSQSNLGSERSGSTGSVRRGSTTSPDPGGISKRSPSDRRSSASASMQHGGNSRTHSAEPSQLGRSQPQRPHSALSSVGSQPSLVRPKSVRARPQSAMAVRPQSAMAVLHGGEPARARMQDWKGGEHDFTSDLNKHGRPESPVSGWIPDSALSTRQVVTHKAAGWIQTGGETSSNSDSFPNSKISPNIDVRAGCIVPKKIGLIPEMATRDFSASSSNNALKPKLRGIIEEKSIVEEDEARAKGERWQDDVITPSRPVKCRELCIGELEVAAAESETVAFMKWSEKQRWGRPASAVRRMDVIHTVSRFERDPGMLPRPSSASTKLRPSSAMRPSLTIRPKSADVASTTDMTADSEREQQMVPPSAAANKLNTNQVKRPATGQGGRRESNKSDYQMSMCTLSNPAGLARPHSAPPRQASIVGLASGGVIALKTSLLPPKTRGQMRQTASQFERPQDLGVESLPKEGPVQAGAGLNLMSAWVGLTRFDASAVGTHRSDRAGESGQPPGGGGVSWLPLSAPPREEQFPDAKSGIENAKLLVSPGRRVLSSRHREKLRLAESLNMKLSHDQIKYELDANISPVSSAAEVGEEQSLQNSPKGYQPHQARKECLVKSAMHLRDQLQGMVEGQPGDNSVPTDASNRSPSRQSSFKSVQSVGPWDILQFDANTPLALSPGSPKRDHSLVVLGHVEEDEGAEVSCSSAEDGEPETQDTKEREDEDQSNAQMMGTADKHAEEGGLLSVIDTSINHREDVSAMASSDGARASEKVAAPAIEVEVVMPKGPSPQTQAGAKTRELEQSNAVDCRNGAKERLQDSGEPALLAAHEEDRFRRGVELGTLARQGEDDERQTTPFSSIISEGHVSPVPQDRSQRTPEPSAFDKLHSDLVGDIDGIERRIMLQTDIEHLALLASQEEKNKNQTVSHDVDYRFQSRGMNMSSTHNLKSMIEGPVMEGVRDEWSLGEESLSQASWEQEDAKSLREQLENLDRLQLSATNFRFLGPDGSHPSHLVTGLNAQAKIGWETTFASEVLRLNREKLTGEVMPLEYYKKVLSGNIHVAHRMVTECAKGVLKAKLSVSNKITNRYILAKDHGDPTLERFYDGVYARTLVARKYRSWQDFVVDRNNLNAMQRRVCANRFYAELAKREKIRERERRAQNEALRLSQQGRPKTALT